MFVVGCDSREKGELSIKKNLECLMKQQQQQNNHYKHKLEENIDSMNQHE